ncbi:COP9 signalosome complex subunit 2 [Mucor velutinosus]|uniref:COP9 signalosome complex subunit 2 n=1 Tax=Mucor velutinosus TaxID=708070 RepID=A0AAN7DI99_9FUNG|nr:COP9 signalosome complex subunit 2 [Mucor velutinosus]
MRDTSWSTVLNSLVLSKCWYVLRVTPFAQSNVQAIRSICTKFLRKGIFPVIPWATWTKPKPLGGLGVLDVALQQSALYFRWVQPLLHPSDSPHILDLLLVMLVNKQNQSAHEQVPLLFPLTRTTGLTKQRTNTVTMIYKSVDCLKRINEPVHLNIATALILPAKAILRPSATVSKSYNTAHMVVLVTLGNIWRAQVRVIFHSTPFTWIDVVQQIKNRLLQLHAQTEIHKQL